MFKFCSVITRTITSTRPFPLLPWYTTAADTSDVVTNYLISSLGFSKRQAVNTSWKLIPFETTEQPDSVIDFLRRSGLSQTQIKNLVLKWPSLLSCDVDKTLNPITQNFYNIGLSMSDIANAVDVSPLLLASTPFKSIIQRDSVIDFFRLSGFWPNQIKNLVLKSPKVLSCDVDKVLTPKLDPFHGMGFSGTDVGHILSEYPAVLESTLNDDFVTTIELLKTVLRAQGNGGNEVLMTVVKQWPKFLNTECHLYRVVPFLENYGLTPSQLRTFAVWKTRYMSLGTDMLERVHVLVKAENLVRIYHESPMFLNGIIAMCTVNEIKLKLKMGVYRRYGFTDEDLLKVVRRNPHALIISVPKLSKCLEFFINDVGFRASELAEVPCVLTFSYVRRIRPRYAVWKCLNDKAKINQSLISCLILSEAQFFEKYVVPLEDECPDVYHDYVKRVRSTDDCY